MTFKRIGNQPNGYYFIYIIDNTLTAQLYLSQMDDIRGFFQELCYSFKFDVTQQ